MPNYPLDGEYQVSFLFSFLFYLFISFHLPTIKIADSKLDAKFPDAARPRGKRPQTRSRLIYLVHKRDGKLINRRLLQRIELTRGDPRHPPVPDNMNDDLRTALEFVYGYCRFWDNGFPRLVRRMTHDKSRDHFYLSSCVVEKSRQESEPFVPKLETIEENDEDEVSRAPKNTQWVDKWYRMAGKRQSKWRRRERDF